LAFFVSFILFMNLKEKPSSNRGVVQRKVVTYGRSIKDRREEKKLRPFGCSSISSLNHFTENLHGCPINHWSIEEKNKSFDLFVFFNLLINLTEKHISSITKKQKKNWVKEKEKLLPFWCSSFFSWILKKPSSTKKISYIW